MVAILVALAVATHVSATARPAVALYLAAALPWVLLVRAARGLDAREALRIAFVGGLIARVVLLFGEPVLSDDLWRFVWDGRVLAAGHNPYGWAPDALALQELRDEAWRRVNHPDVSTVYPPGAQLLFAVAALARGGPLLVRGLVVGLDMLAIVLLSRRGIERGVPEAGLAYALCPLAAVESALSAHFDGPAAVLLLVGLLAFGSSRVRAGLLVGASIALKTLGFLALPVVCLQRRWGRGWATVGIAVGLVVALALPFSGAGWQLARGLSEFALRWAGNASAFVVLEAGTREALRPFEVRPGAVRSRLLGEISAATDGTPFDPRGPLRRDREKKSQERDVFETGYLASLLTRCIVLLVVFAIASFLARRRPIEVAALGTLAAALLLAPVVHPWYVLWLLPFGLLLRAAPFSVWATLAPLAFLPLDGFRETGEWVEPLWARLLEYVPVYGALVIWLRTLWVVPQKTVD